MSRDESKLRSKLEARQTFGNHRSLNIRQASLIDFSSNDYLGLAQHEGLKNQIISEYERSDPQNGSTGSRLLTGNSELLEKTEDFLAGLFVSDRTLLFGSGYLANVAFLSSVPQRNNIILYDELSHASIKDGARLSLAKKISFRHNDVSHLTEKLQQLESNTEAFVVVESVYSMDGDLAPLADISSVCEKYGAKLVVDEAHSTGVWGAKGSGLVCESGLQDYVYARIMTFGKAMGVHGACVCGSNVMIDYMVNFARPFIYTTAISSFETIAIRAAFEFLGANQNLQKELARKIDLFQSELHIPKSNLIQSESAVQAIIIGGNSDAINLSKSLSEHGFDVRPILSPTVAETTERLRICLHTFNSDSDILSLCNLLNNYFSN